MRDLPEPTSTETARALRLAAPSARVSVHLGAAEHEARRLQEDGQHDPSVRLLHQRLSGDATNAEAWWLLSVAMLAQGRPWDALETAESGLKLRLREEWGHRLRSIALLLLGQRRRALEAATEAARLDPAEPMAFVTLSAAALASGKLNEAEASAERALALAPRLADAHLARAEVALARRRWSDAEVAARAALEILPEDPPALIALAAALTGQRRRDEALSAYAAAAANESAGGPARTHLLRAWAAPMAGGLGIVAYVTFAAARGALRDFNEMTVLGALAVVLLAVLGVGIWGVYQRHRDAAALSPSARAMLAEDDRRRGWRRALPLLPLAGFVIVVLIGLIAIARPKASLALEVGDCFSVRRASTIEQVLSVACEVPHDFELFAVFEYPADTDAPYPGLDALQAYARRMCPTAYERYLGVPFDAGARLWIKPFVPEPSYWEIGIRRVMCAVGDPEGQQLVGSARAEIRD